MYDIFNTIKENKMNLVLVKIFYNDKSQCNASENWLLSLLKSFTVLTNKVEIHMEELKLEDIQVID